MSVNAIHALLFQSSFGSRVISDCRFSRAPNEQIKPKALRDISRLLVMFEDCLKRCSIYHLEEFDLLGYLS